jgi:hypothetical protein
MQNLRIIPVNLWREGLMLGASSEDSEYPAESTQDDDTSFVWRSADAALTPTIDIDLGSAYAYDYVALLNHNLTSAATIEIQGADDDAFSINVVTDTLDFNGQNIRSFLTSARTKRYVRVYIQDASNPSNYIQIGTIIVGQFVDLGSPIMGAGYEDGFGDDSVLGAADSGNEYLVQERLRRESMAFQIRLTETTRANVNNAIYAAGLFQAIEFCFDYTTPNFNTIWAKIITINRVAYSHPNYWTWAVEIKASL